MLGIVARHADRLIDHEQLTGIPPLGQLDLPIDVTERFEVLVELDLAGC